MQQVERLSQFIEGAKIKSYKKGQIILHQGEATDSMWFLKSGVIKIHNIDDHGNDKILHIIEEMTVFPVVHHFVGSERVAWFYSALTDVDTYILPFSILEKAMESDGVLATHVLKRCAVDAQELLVRIDSMGKTATSDKLRAALKFLAVNYSSDSSGWRRVRFPVSHQLLADMTGITRESVTVAMRKLQKESVIRSPRLAVVEINLSQLLAK